MKSAETLSSDERTILSNAKNKDTIKTLTEKTGLKESKVRRAVEWLKYKGMLDTTKKTRKIVNLGANGKQYLKKSLPEQRFLEAGEHGLNKVREKAGLSAEEFNYSLGFLKKGKVISIDKGIVKILNKKKIKELEKTRKTLKTLDNVYYSSLNKEKQKIVDALIKRKDILVINEESEQIITLTKKGLKAKKTVGQKKFIEKLTPNIIRSGEWKTSQMRAYDISAPAPKIFAGKNHPYTLFIEELKETLVSMGFEEMEGPLIEKSLYNCDALFMPQDHNARGIHDIFFTQSPKHCKTLPDIKNLKSVHQDGWTTGSKGWGIKFSEEMCKRLVFRSQGTALSARTMMNQPKIPGRYFAVAKCFRPDVIDFKHNIEFNQVEGIVLDKNLNLKTLLGMLKMFAEKVANAKQVKYVPGYFPFTEPSVEIMAKVPGIGWIELGGSGIFRPEVTQPLGIKVPVIAWGLGLDRLFMIKEGISDIRDLFTQDLDWLRSREVRS